MYHIHTEQLRKKQQLMDTKQNAKQHATGVQRAKIQIVQGGWDALVIQNAIIVLIWYPLQRQYNHQQ